MLIKKQNQTNTYQCTSKHQTLFYEQAMLVDLRKVQMEKWGKKKLGGRRKRDGADVTDKKK